MCIRDSSWIFHCRTFHFQNPFLLAVIDFPRPDIGEGGTPMRRTLKSVTTLVVVLILITAPVVGQTTKAKPEDVGISTERLKRVHELIQRHLDAGSFSGAVTLVARNGRIAHLEAQGLMDIETKKPCL